MLILPKLFWIGGTVLFGTASALAGRALFSNRTEDIVIYETVAQTKFRMEQFKQEVKDGDEVPVAAFPMPGETMIWLTPKEGNKWKAKFESMPKAKKTDLKNDMDLRKWCQIQKVVTKVHIVKKEGQPFKFKMSLDSKTHHSNLVQATDLEDLKNFCSRSITNKEWFGPVFKDSKDVKVEDRKIGNEAKSCEYWMKQPYSKSNTSFLKPCLRYEISKEEIVGYGYE